MVLSIGMIVKNEEKYLDRCLSALKPILDNVDSELIIADTGSTDNTVEIAKKYTDNVFYFEWINDFAAARNSTIERAKGEWYMFIDADEIFESCDDIINFFNSGMYKSYKSACYILKNYADSNDLSIFSSIYITRLFCLTSDTKFVGCVHETIQPALNSAVKLNSVAGHYGYLFNDKEIKEKKFKRNSELLLKRLETETPTRTLYLQLAQTFGLENEENRLKYAQMGLECSNGGDYSYIALYNEKVSYYYRTNQWEKVLEVSEEYFRDTEKLRSEGNFSTDADMAFFRATGFKGLNRNKECIAEIQKLFSLYNSIKKGELLTDDVLFCPLKIAVDGNIDFAKFLAISACTEEKEYEAAEEYLKSVNISDYYVADDKLNKKLYDDFEIMRHKKDYRRVQALYNQLSSDARQNLHLFMRREAEIKNTSPEVNNLFRKITKNEPDFSGLLETVKEHLAGESCLESAKKLSETALKQYGEVLYYLLSEKQDISLITTIENYNFRTAVIFCSDAFKDFYDILENYPIENVSPKGLNGLLNLVEASMEQALRENRDIEALFSLWGITGLAICEANNLGADDLSGQLFGAVMAAEAINEKSQGNYKDCLNALIALLKQYPSAKPFVLAIRDKIQAQTQPVKEMNELSARFKENIRMLISNGELEQARQLLAEYEKIMPDDSETAELEQAINNQ